MHILFVGYGKTSQRVAKHLFQSGHKVSTISRSSKPVDGANHLIQDIHQLDLNNLAPVDWVYVLLSPSRGDVEAYSETYLHSVAPIVQALKNHPVQRVVVVSSTRVYGEHQGETIDDTSMLKPFDAQGQVLLDMEQAWLAAYPQRCSIVRPSGIYGTSVARMIKLAHSTQDYPNIHWSNRIHIEDLAAFLAYLLHVEQPASAYIITNNQPMPLHQTILWFQKQLNLPQLVLKSEVASGKKIYAKAMFETGFKLQHPDCLIDYETLLQGQV